MKSQQINSPTRFDANVDTVGVRRDLLAALVPKGIWHRVDILSPSKIMYATPGPGGEYRSL